MLAGKPSVLIVGAGIIGISTAYYLMKSERCGGITLIEEGEPAGGASGYAAGFLAKNWHGAPTAVSCTIELKKKCLVGRNDW